jgi:hypothetical protein
MLEDVLKRQADRQLRDLLNEFTIRQSRSGDRPTAFSARVAIGPQPPSPPDQREYTLAANAFAAFQDLLMHRAPLLDLKQPRILRIPSFDNANHPWFDILIEGTDGSFTFKVMAVHPIKQLQSSA